jgi:hypothetical protein
MAFFIVTAVRTSNLTAVNKVAIWTRKWQIKLGASISVHIDFTSKKIRQQSIFISGIQVAYTNTVKYLGMTVDAKLW